MKIAIPDYYLSETHTIVEIKSKYFLDEQNMFDKFQEYRKLGFNTVLVLDGVETPFCLETPDELESSSIG